MTQTGHDSVPCMKKDDKFSCFHKEYSCYERIQCSTTVRLKSTEKFRFYSRRLGPPRLVLPTNSLGPCTRPTRPSPSFPRTHRTIPGHPDRPSRATGAHRRPITPALQQLFSPLLSREHILYLHGSLHTTPPPLFPLLLSHLQQWRSTVRRRRRHSRRRRRFPCRYVPRYLWYFSQPESPQLNTLHYVSSPTSILQERGAPHSNPGARIQQI
jgi:hypothetical protein